MHSLKNNWDRTGHPFSFLLGFIGNIILLPGLIIGCLWRMLQMPFLIEMGMNIIWFLAPALAFVGLVYGIYDFARGKFGWGLAGLGLCWLPLFIIFVCFF